MTIKFQKLECKKVAAQINNFQKNKMKQKSKSIGTHQENLALQSKYTRQPSWPKIQKIQIYKKSLNHKQIPLEMLRQRIHLKKNQKTPCRTLLPNLEIPRY